MNMVHEQRLDPESCQAILLGNFQLLVRLRADEPEAWDEIHELYEDDSFGFLLSRGIAGTADGRLGADADSRQEGCCLSRCPGGYCLLQLSLFPAAAR